MCSSVSDMFNWRLDEKDGPPHLLNTSTSCLLDLLFIEEEVGSGEEPYEETHRDVDMSHNVVMSLYIEILLGKHPHKCIDTFEILCSLRKSITLSHGVNPNSFVIFIGLYRRWADILENTYHSSVFTMNAVECTH